MGFALSSMQLTSPAFGAGGAIPARHTGEAEDVSPALGWTDAPAGTQSFAVVCHDPDAPLVTPGHYGYVHWVLYNILLGAGAGCEPANLDLEPGLSLWALLERVEPHVIGMNRLVGTYQRG